MKADRAYAAAKAFWKRVKSKEATEEEFMEFIEDVWTDAREVGYDDGTTMERWNGCQ